jgi:hypothetical protein
MRFLAILRVQWQWSRAVTGPATLLLLGLPFLMLQGVTSAKLPVEVMYLVASWTSVLPAVAALLGLLVALAAWAADRRGQHIHALSLPIARWRYVLLRYQAGLVLLAFPLLGFLAGTVLAVGATSLPAGLQGYPWALAARFATAALLAFSLFFAILSGTPKTAGIVLGLLVALVAVNIGVAFLAPGEWGGSDLLFLILGGPGPLSIFAGRWVLVDV